MMRQECLFVYVFVVFPFHSMLISAVWRPQNEDFGNSKKTFTKNPLPSSAHRITIKQSHCALPGRVHAALCCLLLLQDAPRDSTRLNGTLCPYRTILDSKFARRILAMCCLRPRPLSLSIPTKNGVPRLYEKLRLYLEKSTRYRISDSLSFLSKFPLERLVDAVCFLICRIRLAIFRRELFVLEKLFNELDKRSLIPVIFDGREGLSIQ